MRRHDATYDAIVVGGGPAGLAAALMLGRTRRHVLLLDSAQYRNANATAMHNVLSHDGRSPTDFRRLAREDLVQYATVEQLAGEACAATADGDVFTVELADGTVREARRLLLATGLTDDLPPIPGLADIWGRSALHCPYCHGYEVRGTPLAVLGSPHAERLALLLSRLSPDVAVLTNGADDLDPAARSLLDANGIVIRDEPIARLEHQDGQLERVVFMGGSVLARQAIFVPPAQRQRSALAAQLGCAMFPDGLVEVDDFQQTTVPGVLAAGDMARRSGQPAVAAVIPAAASGMIAAAMIDHGLLAADFGIASPAVAR